MTYFYNYFAKEYREGRMGRLLPAPAALFRGIKPEDVKNCRRALKNSFAGYREGRNTEALKRLLGEYREYVSCCHDEHAKDRYNAFVYRYMVEAHVGSRAIAAKLGVVKETVLNHIDRCIDEMLMLCMGIPAVLVPPEDGEAAVRMLVDGSRLFNGMAGDYVLCLFPGKKERVAVEHGRQLTRQIMGQLTEAAEAYFRYCCDGHTHIDTDIRKAEILQKCIAGELPAAIAEEYGCSIGTVYSDIRENEKRLAAMLFNVGKSSVPNVISILDISNEAASKTKGLVLKEQLEKLLSSKVENIIVDFRRITRFAHPFFNYSFAALALVYGFDAIRSIQIRNISQVGFATYQASMENAERVSRHPDHIMETDQIIDDDPKKVMP